MKMFAVFRSVSLVNTTKITVAFPTIAMVAVTQQTMQNHSDMFNYTTFVQMKKTFNYAEKIRWLLIVFAPWFGLLITFVKYAYISIAAACSISF